MKTRLRSVLLCTPINPRHVEKALQSPADLVVFDLEDSVEVERKAQARAAVVHALEQPFGRRSFVRSNAIGSAQFEADLDALAPLSRVGGFMLPKFESPDDLRALDARLSRLEERSGRAAGSIRVLPLIETALGVENLREILLDSPRVDRLSFGAGDYTLDIGATLSDDEAALHYIRARVVNASRAFGKQAPIDSIWLDTSDLEGLQRSALRGQTLGFAGKLCIHPNQVEAVNAVYTPSPQAMERARRQLAAFGEALGRGVAAIHVDGMLVDYPIAERARRLLAAGDVNPS